ncbi:hypothetical protein L1987_21037 [Smallanthus sonchifolius]|uniref:Uncharacterized protein n=1 Tax=Smallanthus sonchifolius TaxID=185202 RepID=A0ACB9IUZ8_9ASTR|nr:hypothetical protein L1987_21037 [Smallanthus sonchifolius]
METPNPHCFEDQRLIIISKQQHIKSKTASEIWSALEKHFYEHQSTTTANPNLGSLGDGGGVSAGPSGGQEVSSGRLTIAHGAAMSQLPIAYLETKTTSPTDVDTRNDGIWKISKN